MDGAYSRQTAGDEYDDEFAVHVESNTVSRVKRRRVSRVLDRWLAADDPLFGPPARQAIQHCQRLWEACPTLGRLTASYEPRAWASALSFEDRFASGAQRELAELQAWFPAVQWRVFEAVVRDGVSAGEAGACLADKTPAAIASVKVLVISMASQIAHRKGWQ